MQKNETQDEKSKEINEKSKKTLETNTQMAWYFNFQKGI